MGVWIGGVWNGHFPESEKYFSDAEFSRKIPEIPHGMAIFQSLTNIFQTPNFQGKSLKFRRQSAFYQISIWSNAPSNRIATTHWLQEGCPSLHQSRFRTGSCDCLTHLIASSQPPDYSSNLCPPRTFAI